jgi:hypothetical protein
MIKFSGILLFLSYSLFAQPPKPEVAFIVPEKDLIPEGIAYDPAEKAFYLGSIHKKKIVKVTGKGGISDFVSPGAEGIEEVLGMKVDANGLLWVCNNTPEYDTLRKISNIHLYDLRSRSLYKRFQLTDGKRHLFNDLCILKNGDAYITDSHAGMVWMIRHGGHDIEAFTKPGSLSYPNGITVAPDEKSILVATGSALGIVSIDLASKKITPVSSDRYLLIGLDGLYFYKNGLIGVQNTTFPESVLYLRLAPSLKTIERIEFLCQTEPPMDLPTTGVMGDGYFYFIANSQVHQINGGRGQIKDPDSLKDVAVMKIKLN